MDQMKQKHPVYQRTTELRHVRDNDIYELIRMLDENECWRQLMEIIPKRFDAFESSAPGGLKYDEIIAVYGCKYTPTDIKLIENAYGRTGPYEHHSAILFEEWKTSGRSNERPTLGVLLQLLVHADLYRAADFVAEKLLNEPKPLRPTGGPAAVVMLDTDEIMDFDSESSLQPITNTLNDDAHRNHTETYNKDFFLKHRVMSDKDVSIKPNNVAPIPPPRTRSARQLEQNQHLLANVVMPNTTVPYQVVAANSNNQLLPTTDSDAVDSLKQSSLNIPKFSLLNAVSTSSAEISTSNNENGSSMNEPSKNGAEHSEIGNHNKAPLEANIPMVSLLCDISTAITSDGAAVSTSETESVNSTATTTTTIGVSSNCVSGNSNNLPLISELNLLGDRDRRESAAGTTSGIGVQSRHNSESSYSNDDDDDVDDDYYDDGDGDASLPNLSNFDQRSSNNDSSLTTVTGTSGDNSFELTNDSSSASNDDNIPDLSILQKK